MTVNYTTIKWCTCLCRYLHMHVRVYLLTFLWDMFLSRVFIALTSVIWNRTPPPPFPLSEIGFRFFFSFNNFRFIIILIARCMNFRRMGGASSTTTVSTFSFRKGKGVLSSWLTSREGGGGVRKQKKKRRFVSRLNSHKMFSSFFIF